MLFSPIYLFLFVLVLYFINLKIFLNFIHGSSKWLSFLLSEIFELSVREFRSFRLKCIFQLFGLHDFYLIGKIDLEFFSFGEKYLFYFKSLLSMIANFFLEETIHDIKLLDFCLSSFHLFFQKFILTANIIRSRESESFVFGLFR